MPMIGRRPAPVSVPVPVSVMMMIMLMEIVAFRLGENRSYTHLDPW